MSFSASSVRTHNFQFSPWCKPHPLSGLIDPETSESRVHRPFVKLMLLQGSLIPLVLVRRHLNPPKGRLWCWALVSESVALSILCCFLPLLDSCLGSQPSFSYMLSYYRVNAYAISFISAVSFVFIILFYMVVGAISRLWCINVWWEDADIWQTGAPAQEGGPSLDLDPE